MNIEHKSKTISFHTLYREEFQSYTYKHQYSLRDLIPDSEDLTEDEL